jgi:peptidoglycan/LPS O-acetylase OafA/YrhL
MFLTKFLRNPSSGNYIREVDALRFFAILPVLMLHMNTSFFRNFETVFFNELEFSFLKHGIWGVELFFAISGFVISLPFFIKIQSHNYNILTKNYFIKRFKRIEPPFIVSLLIIYIISLVSTRLVFSDSIDNFIASLFYVHKFIYAEWSTINPVTWSLETEIQFYMFIPFIFLAFSKIKKVYIYILASLIFAISIYLHSSVDSVDLLGPRLNKSILRYAHLFIVGIYISYLYVYKNQYFKKSFIFDVIFLISFALIYAAKILDLIVLLDIGIFLLFISIFKSKIFNKLFCKNIFVIIGGMCYSIYLLHYAIIHFSHNSLKFLQIENYIIVNTLSIILVIFISSIFYLYVEKPFMTSVKNK